MTHSGNWKDRYGTDTFDNKGKLKEKGDLALLTPAQRHRVVKKERAAAKDTRRPQRRLVQTRRLSRKSLMERMLTGVRRSGRSGSGAGTARARERERAIFGDDHGKLFDETGRRRAEFIPPEKYVPKKKVISGKERRQQKRARSK